MSATERTPIQEFYNDAVIFITGGSGFIGTALTEKLLRTCPDIKKIYLLMRSKKEKNADQRFEEIFNDSVWETLKEQNPNFKNKISIILGDLLEDDLGLSEEDYIKLRNEVSIIFHVAATVRFNEYLKQAVQLNIKATKYILNLANQCKNIKSVVYVSTAFSQCYQCELDDCFYPPIINPEELITYCEKFTVEELNEQTTSILGPYPNTYAFTKSLAENIVKSYENQLPLAVSRPSIVYGCAEDPIPGWTNSFFGPIGLTVGIGMGIIRVIPCNFEAKIDFVPVDMFVNQLIAVAYETSKHKKSAKVYNYVNGSDNPITWGKYFHYSMSFANTYACLQTLWVYSIIYPTNPYLIPLCQFFIHLVPAFLIDTYLRLTGKEPKLLKVYAKIHKLLGVLRLFMVTPFEFRSDNTRELFEKLDPRDQILLPFDIRKIVWDRYIFNVVRYARIYMLNEPITNVMEAQKKMSKLRIAHNTLMIFFLVMIYWFFSYLFKLFK